jgi:hypothetical protein
VVDEVVCGGVAGRVKVAYECSTGHEGGFVTIDRMWTSPDGAEEVRVHGV